MKISLKQKKLTTGKLSLYIEYFKGSTIDRNGKKIHSRDFEYLKLYLFNNPSSAEQKKENKETLELANNILCIRQADFIHGKHNIKNNEKGKILFLEFYTQKKEERYQTKGNYDNWEAAQKHLEAFCPQHITFDDIDVDFIKSFKKYLDTVAVTKSEKKLSQNTKHTYYNKFKATLNAAFEEGYLSENLSKKVKGFTMGESKREYLTHEEVQKLSQTKCKLPILKRAFIFSVLSGIRWSDINKLVWSEVRDEGLDELQNPVHRILFTQKKTDGVEYLYISQQARQLLGKRGNHNDRVFKGLRYSAHMNMQLLRWCMDAGITKHITFHSARHTNAVLLLENGADIYTVSKRLGHREIRTTEIYTKIVDKKMKEAANIIPELNLEL